MPLVNYCRKCLRKRPLAKAVPYCGEGSPKPGSSCPSASSEPLVTDWFSWNDVLRVALPAWLVALGSRADG